MRILIVNYEYPPVGAGAATASEWIAKELVKLGHFVVILTGRHGNLPGFSDDKGTSIYRIPSLRRSLDRASLLEMASFLAAGLICAPGIMRKHQIEGAIVFFSLPCGPIGLLGRWFSGVPYIVSLRGGDVPGAEARLSLIHRILKPIRRLVLSKSIAIVANSDGLQKMAEAADPFPVRVIANGVDTDFFSPKERKEKTRHAGLRVLFAGRFQEQKNLPFLLEQLAQTQVSAIELHLVGDGPQRKQLEDLAAQLGIGAAITWHGWLPRSALPDIYRSVDCLINPSLYEGMPNVVLEAMACGLPVIASNVPGNAQLVISGETGFLFDLDEAATLNSALSRLQDDDLRSRMEECARARVIQLFSWKTAAAQYANLLSVEASKT